MSALRRAVGVLAALTTAAAAATVPTVLAGASPASGPGDQATLARSLGADGPSAVHVVRDRASGLVRFVGTRAGHPLARPAGVGPTTAPGAAAHAFLGAHAGLFGIADPAGQLTATRTERLPGGGHVARFQERVGGYPVLGGELAVALTADNAVLSVDGATVAAGAPDQAVRITAAQAVRIAVGVTASSERLRTRRLSASTPSLVVYDPHLLGVPTSAPTSLVYRVEVATRGHAARPVRELVLVDATKGAVTLHFDQVERAAQVTVCTASGDLDVVDPTCPPTGDPGQPTQVGSPSTSGDSDTASAADLAQGTYDFYSSVVGDVSKLGVAGTGGARALDSTVHFCDPASTDTCLPWDNAAWDGHEMVYGDGFAGADDVVAHELTHGVTEHTSNLYYLYQSGAINESMSDVMGELFDQWNGAGSDADGDRWLIGEDLPGGASRHMDHPESDCQRSDDSDVCLGDPDRMGSSDYCSGDDAGCLADNGGVHVDSGVGNKAAYLIVDGDDFNGVHVAGLGGADPSTRATALAKAAKIYLAADEMLISGSDYADLFQVLPQACRNLVGTAAGTGTIADADCQTVTAAVTATQMNQQPAGAATQSAPVCDNGLAMSSDWYDDLENPASGNWARSSSSGPWYYPASHNLYDDAPQVYATSGTHELWGDNVDPEYFAQFFMSPPTDGTITLTRAIRVPAGKPAYLRFDQAYLFQWFVDSGTGKSYYPDGGRIEYSVDGGKHWLSARALLPAGTYRHITGFSSYAGGVASGVRYDFYGLGGDSHGYGSTRLNLSSLAGKWVRLRFRVTSDAAFAGLGWFIDDVRFYACGARPAAPASVGVTAGVTQLPVTWTAPADHGTSALTGYHLSLRSGSTVLRTVDVPASTRAWTFKGLPGGTPLTAYVAAVNAAGTGPAVRSRTLTGSALSIKASATSVASGHRVTISGRLVQAGTTHGLGGKVVGLYRAKVGSSAWSYLTRTTTGAQGYYAFHPLVPATYSYRVRFGGSPYYQGALSTHRTVRVS